MKTREEIKKWLLENCVNKRGDLCLLDLDFSDFDGDIYAVRWEVKRNLHQSGQKVGGNLHQNRQTVEKQLIQNQQKVGWNLYQSCQEVGGNLHQNLQEVNGNLNQNRQEVKGRLRQGNQKVGGDLIQDHQKVGGDLIQDSKDKEYRVVFYDGDGHEEWTSYYDSIEAGIEDEIDEEIINATSKPDYYVIQEREVGEWTDVEKCGVE